MKMKIFFSNFLLICGLLFCFTLEVTSHLLENDAVTKNSSSSDDHKISRHSADTDSIKFNSRKRRNVVEDMAQNALDSGKKIANNVADHVVDGFVAGKNKASDTAKELGKSIQKTAGEAFDSGKKAAKGVVDGIKNKASDTGKKLGKSIQETAGEAFDSGKKAAKEVVDGIKNKYNKATGAASASSTRGILQNLILYIAVTNALYAFYIFV